MGQDTPPLRRQGWRPRRHRSFADVRRRQRCRYPRLDTATLRCAERTPAAIYRLLDAGADIDALTEKGMPSIYWAATAASGDPVAAIRVLRACGADPRRETIQTYFGPKSPLHFINEWSDQDVIQAEFKDLGR